MACATGASAAGGRDGPRAAGPLQLCAEQGGGGLRNLLLFGQASPGRIQLAESLHQLGDYALEFQEGLRYLDLLLLQLRTPDVLGAVLPALRLEPAARGEGLQQLLLQVGDPGGLGSADCGDELAGKAAK